MKLVFDAASFYFILFIYFWLDLCFPYCLGVPMYAVFLQYPVQLIPFNFIQRHFVNKFNFYLSTQPALSTW